MELSYSKVDDEEDGAADVAVEEPQQQMSESFSSGRKLQLAALKIQHTYQRRRVVFSLCGAQLFSRKGGDGADFGELWFPTTNTLAPFITVADTTSASMLASYMELTWKLPRPEVLISVTGGAQVRALLEELCCPFDVTFAFTHTAPHRTAPVCALLHRTLSSRQCCSAPSTAASLRPRRRPTRGSSQAARTRA